MDEDKKSRISTFRFGVIHDLVGHVQLESGEQERLIRLEFEKSKCAKALLVET